MKGACGWSGVGKRGVDGRGDGFQRPCERVGRAIGKLLRCVPGWGTSEAVGRSAGAAALATWALRSIPLSRRRRRSGGVRGRCVGFRPLREVVQDPLHDRRVLDAGDHLDGAAALPRFGDFACRSERSGRGELSSLCYQ